MNVSPDLIVIDTLTREMTGMDENSNNDAKLVQRFNEEMAEHYGCMVLAIGHTGKDQSRGLRGAQVFIDNSDAVHYLKKHGEGVVLQPKKLKEVDTDDKTVFLEVEKDKYGKSITLAKCDEMPDITQRKETKSRHAWASVHEVLKVLNSLKGEASDMTLETKIAGAHGLDRNLVHKVLYANDDLTFLRPTSGKWKIPEQEHDL
jgi:hypothetical protein